MSTFNKLYERTIARLLADHTTKSIPADLDLWPAILERIAQPEELADGSGQERRVMALQSRTSLPAASAPSGEKRRENKLFRYGGALAGFATLAAMGVVVALAISLIAQRPPTTAIDAPQIPVVTPQPLAEETRLLFSIPLGKAGIRYVQPHTPGGIARLSPFLAAAPNGTFWVADGDSRLLHYDATGKRLGSVPLPANKGEPRQMEIRGDNFWLLFSTQSPSGEYSVSTIYRLGPDGKEIRTYPVPDYLSRRVRGFLLGENGELLLKGEFTDLIATSPYFPEPVPTQEMPQVPAKPYWQLADAQGNPTSTALEVYSRGGRSYSTRTGFQGSMGRGYVRVGDVEVVITAGDVLWTVDLLHVEDDGSFYVLVVDDTGVGDPYIIVDTTIRHYSVDGKLLEHARVPMLNVGLITGHSGDFYTLIEQPSWEQRGGKEPERIDVRRLTFYPATQPLPTLPPATPTTTPLPTTTLPPPPTEPGKVNTDDLRELKAKSDAVAQVRVFGHNEFPSGHVIYVEVQRWFSRSGIADVKTIDIFIPEDLWAKMPANFRDDPMTQDRKQQSVYILFLSKGENDYELTDGSSGAFMVSGGYIRDAGIAKYNGWPVDAFINAIADTNFITPTVAVPQETPTRVSSAEPVSFVRDGEGFRLDVHEGVASFGLGFGTWSSSPWIGSSALVVQWDSITERDQSKSYLLNLVGGKLESLPWSAREWSAIGHSDGRRAIMVKAAEQALTIKLADIETGKTETVYDLVASVPQWAGAEAHAGDLGTLPFYVYASASWVGQDAFVLALKPRIDKDITDYASKLLLVNTARREVRVLAARGTLAEPLSNGVLLWQSGGVDGGLQMLTPPYTDQPATIAPGGNVWIRDWTTTPDGQRVAWVEAKAPPGDWARKLPFTCRPCGGTDPEPQVEAIAIWDRATGQTNRYPVRNLIWSFSNTNMLQKANLRWRNDGSSLLYATHSPDKDKGGAENAGRTAIYELAINGNSNLLSEHAWYGQLDTLWEGNDGSIYYYVRGEKSVGAGDIIRRHPDGKLEVLYAYTGEQAWTVDRDGYLEMLNGNSVTVTNLNTGDTRKATFSQVDPGQFDTGWGSIASLVPISPDTKWAAFAGSNSDAIMVSPDGTPDRGKRVYIVPIK